MSTVSDQLKQLLATSTKNDLVIVAMDQASQIVDLKQDIVTLTKDKNSLTSKIDEMKPKVNHYNIVAGMDNWIEVGDLSKKLAFRDMGPHQLFIYLRDRKILIDSVPGSPDRNLPYASYIKQRYFKVIEVLKNGKLFNQTVVSPRGEVWITNMLLGDGYEPISRI
jgi:phage antirepressor YoqD-like protein